MGHAMSSYTITVTLSDRWSQTFASDQLVDDVRAAELLASGAVVMAGLKASWSMTGELLPSQPSPVQTTLSLFVPDVTAFTPPEDGEHCSVVLTPDGWDSTTGTVPFETYGRVSDVTAVPLRDGLRLDLVVSDYLAELGEEMQTGRHNELSDSGVPWYERWAAIVARSRYSFPYPPIVSAAAYLIELNARAGGNPASTLALLEEVCVDSVAWYNALRSVIDPDDPVILPNAKWERAYVTYSYTGPDQSIPELVTPERVVSYGNGLMSSTVIGPNDLVYRLAIAADYSTSLQLRDGEPGVVNNDPRAGSYVQVIDGSAIQLPSLQWRQARRTTPNSVRLAGEFTQGNVGSGPVVEEVTRRNEGEVARRGLVEAAGTSQAFFEAYGWAVALAYLGDRYAQTSRFSVEQVVIEPERIADWRRWPYFFQSPASRYLTGVWNTIVLTGIPDERNLYRRPEYPARLIGAELEISDGRLTITGALRHDVPRQEDSEGRLQLTAAHLAAAPLGINLRASHMGELTAVDLRLVAEPAAAPLP